MREILGRRRRLLSRRSDGGPELIDAALTFATEWQWPVLPGVTANPHGMSRCGCPDPECSVPGAHPFDPGLLTATTDARMVRWWWTNRPTAPIVLATGGTAPCAVSLPALAASHALVALDRQGMRLGPVVASATRWSILVRPYEGGYLALPPSETGQGEIRWERAPLPGSASPWVPDVEAVVDAVVDALTRTGVSAPEL
jgi:hypothetical protein